MGLIPQPPVDVKDTAIFVQLQKISSTYDGLAERVLRLIQTATPLLDLVIAGPFQKYTLHNPGHAKKIVHLAEHLMTDQTLSDLSALECAVIILSAYIHDLGMAVTTAERHKILNAPDFYDHIRSWRALWQRMESLRSRLEDAADAERMRLEAELFQLQEVAISSYLRPRHADADRYRTILNDLRASTGRMDLFEINGVSFEDYLIDICVSHNQNVAVLAEITGPYDGRFPQDLVIGGQRLNTQFCAAILRITDVLDFDRERTPPVLFNSLGIPTNDLPGGDVSLEEWQKHLAVHAIELNEDEIVISADCKHPAIEAAVRNFAEYIEREIRDTTAVIRRNPTPIYDKYKLQLPFSVRTKIRSIGYVFKDLALRLNQSSIMQLLMGERLYRDPGVALRESAQNAIDACSALSKITKGPYSPEVSLKLTGDEKDQRWLQITDNGIGMDEHVLSKFFFEVGNSYYTSPEFERISNRNNQDFISRFGIGTASFFLIGDRIEIETCNPLSARGDSIKRSISVEDVGGLAFVRELGVGQNGTTIRIRLKPAFKTVQAVNYLNQYLLKSLIRPPFPIDVSITSDRVIIKPNDYMRLSTDAQKHYPNLDFIELDMEKYSTIVRGKVIIALGREDNRLVHDPNDSALQFGNRANQMDTRLVAKNYNGNRISVNGFAMTLKHMSRLFRTSKQRQVAFLFDLDVTGVKEVTYDVARDRVVGTGIDFIRAEVRRSIEEGLKKLGFYDQLHARTQKAIDEKIVAQPVSITQDLLDKVQAATAGGLWTKDLPATVAKALHVSKAEAGQAIAALLKDGRIIKDSREQIAPVPKAT